MRHPAIGIWIVCTRNELRCSLRPWEVSVLARPGFPHFWSGRVKQCGHAGSQFIGSGIRRGLRSVPTARACYTTRSNLCAIWHGTDTARGFLMRARSAMSSVQRKSRECVTSAPSSSERSSRRQAITCSTSPSLWISPVTTSRRAPSNTLRSRPATPARTMTLV